MTTFARSRWDCGASPAWVLASLLYHSLVGITFKPIQAYTVMFDGDKTLLNIYEPWLARV